MFQPDPRFPIQRMDFRAGAFKNRSSEEGIFISKGFKRDFDSFEAFITSQIGEGKAEWWDLPTHATEQTLRIPIDNFSTTIDQLFSSLKEPPQLHRERPLSAIMVYEEWNATVCAAELKDYYLFFHWFTRA